MLLNQESQCGLKWCHQSNLDDPWCSRQKTKFENYGMLASIYLPTTFGAPFLSDNEIISYHSFAKLIFNVSQKIYV